MDQTQVSPVKQSTVPIALAPICDLLIRRVWAPAIIAFGLVLTVAWAALLGYGIYILLESAL